MARVGASFVPKPSPVGFAGRTASRTGGDPRPGRDHRLWPGLHGRMPPACVQVQCVQFRYAIPVSPYETRPEPPATHQGPGSSGRLFQISKTRQKKKIRISNPLVSSSGSSPQILGPQLTSSASTSQSVPFLSSPTSLIRRKVTRRTNLAHSGTSQSCTSMWCAGNTKKSSCEEQYSAVSAVPSQKRSSDPQWWVDSETD